MDPSRPAQAPVPSLSSAPPNPSQTHALAPPLLTSEFANDASKERPRALSLLDEPEPEEAPPRGRGSSTLPPSASPHFPLLSEGDRLTESLEQLKQEPAFLGGATRTERRGSLYGQGRNPVLGPDVQAEEVAGEVEIYVPGLTSAALFVLLPMTDSLTPLVEKYIPPQERPSRDLTGDWRGKALATLISERGWRAVASYCQESIINGSPERTSFLLAHWTLRLQALLRLHLIDQAEVEMLALFNLLPPSLYLDPALPPHASPPEPLFHPAVPFEIHVLISTLPGLQGDHALAVESLGDLLRGVKMEMWGARRRGDAEQESVWRERAERVGGITAGVLVEMKAHAAASTLLQSSPTYRTSPALLSSLCRLHLATGDLASFSRTEALLTDQAAATDERRLRKARVLGKVGRGEWVEAEGELRELVGQDKNDAESLNNLAVVLLFSSRLQEAITVLTTLLSRQPTVAYSSETVIFNLATLTELRTDAAAATKVALLRSAVELGGEGLRGTCLKLAY